MLKIVKSIKDLAFAELMEVYREGNLENGQEHWPQLSEGQQLLLAEQDFYQYLREVFFTEKGAVYAIWEENGKYISALRLEPYKGGLLLEALETHPEHRRKGYGEALLTAVRQRVGNTKIYSHVHKGNIPSLKIHEKCGFRRIMEYAVYIDGSYNHRCCTLCCEDTLLLRIHSTNDYERELFGSRRVPFNDHFDRWHSDLRPDQVNNNFFVPTGEISARDIEAARNFQKKRGLRYLMIRAEKPLSRALMELYDMEQEDIYVMALRQDISRKWKKNEAIEIRDIQHNDISRDLLDVSATPEKYQDIARRNMQLVLEVAKRHPEYHWLCAYMGGKRVGCVYALCHNGCIEMDDLWVEEDRRNQYIATTLMKHIAETMEGVMYLHADASATPQDMYAKMGFEIVETVYDYYLEFD